MLDVNFVRKELRDIRPQYRLVRDVVAGEIAVKARGSTYLPHPAPETASTEAGKFRYLDYKTRAVFYGVTARTLRGLVGQIFSREPEIKAPGLLDFMQQRVNGLAVSLKQQLKQSASEVVAYGRAGVLSDFPTMSDGQTVTMAMIMNGAVAPTNNYYEPESIINWRYENDGSNRVLTLVVLHEKYQEPDGIYASNERQRYRVLRLDESGFYTQQIFDGKGTTPIASYAPRDFAGNRLNYIPFEFIGAEDNDPDIDMVPLYDLASVNIGHYRNSAEWEESCFMVGQPTLVVSGVTENWAKNVLGGQIRIGSRELIALPANARADILQPEPNTMAAEGMTAKERRMVALGAKLVEQRAVQRTATEAAQEESAEASQLATIADNVSQAYTNALRTSARFLTGDGINAIAVKLNTAFEVAAMDPASRAQTIKEWQQGAISFDEMRSVLRRGGIATMPDKEAFDKIAEEQGALAEALVITDPNDDPAE